MMSKKICVFNRASRAAAYGIGTYIDQYKKAFRGSDLDIVIVNLLDRGSDVHIEKKDGFEYIYIPAPKDLRRPRMAEYYARNATYLLKDIIGEDENTEYIFHLNFMGDYHLISALKKQFSCKVILVAHYAGWDFTLEGDNKKLRTILADKSRKRKNKREADILNEIQEDQKTISQSDHFICVSKYMQNLFRRTLTLDKGKNSIIYNALEDTYCEISALEKCAIRETYHIDPETKILLYAGRLDSMKGISFLFEAFKKILKEYSDVRLLLVGDGDFSRWMKETEGFWSKVSFTGRLDKQKLYELYKISDIGVVTSLCEPFGLVATEMMMNKLPIIASDTGGLSEIIENSVSGFLVPFIRDKNDNRKLDTDILAKKIKLLIDDPILREEIAVNGRKKFLEKFGLSAFKQKMIDVYSL